MKAVILAGGLGTRISEETGARPKPMIEVGGRPILWHIMKLYSAHGVSDFVICCGYRGYVIKEYFANYFLHMSDVTFDMTTNSMEVHQRKSEPWRVTLVDTGDATMTGGRLRRVADHVRGEDAFFFTYGDGLADVDLTAELAFHRGHGRMATVLAVQPRIDAGNRGANVVLASSVAATLRDLPPGPVLTADYTWWAKLNAYLARERLPIRRDIDPAFLDDAARARARTLDRLPDPADYRGGYVVTGPVRRTAGWPTNWDVAEATIRKAIADADLQRVARVGRATIWRWTP